MSALGRLSGFLQYPMHEVVGQRERQRQTEHRKVRHDKEWGVPMSGSVPTLNKSRIFPSAP